MRHAIGRHTCVSVARWIPLAPKTNSNVNSVAISAHAGVLVGPSGGWNELLDRVSQPRIDS